MPQWRQKLKPDTQNKLQLWLPALITLLVKWQGFFFNALPHNHTCKQLWSHVDGSSYYAARHHGFWFTEAQVGDLCPILFVQLEKAKRWLSNQVENTAVFKFSLIKTWSDLYAKATFTVTWEHSCTQMARCKSPAVGRMHSYCAAVCNFIFIYSMGVYFQLYNQNRYTRSARQEQALTSMWFLLRFSKQEGVNLFFHVNTKLSLISCLFFFFLCALTLVTWMFKIKIGNCSSNVGYSY